MHRRGTLVFTGGSKRGWRNGHLDIGHLNMWRSVAETLMSLSKQHGYGVVNADEVMFAMEIEMLKMVDKGEMTSNDMKRYLDRNKVVSALNNVARASENNTANHIPHGIVKVNSVYYQYQPNK
jgi:hypothetical protein